MALLKSRKHIVDFDSFAWINIYVITYAIVKRPSLLFLNKGSVMDQRVGAVSYEEIANILDKLIEG